MVEYLNLDNLISKYPELFVVENDESHSPRQIKGYFTMTASNKGVTFYEKYHVEIDLLDYEIPYITELDKKIIRRYAHRYSDGGLCLGTTTDILMDCCYEGKFDILKWFEDFVIPYFFSYEYFIRFGEYPFGERSHGKKGILEYYMDILNLQNVNQAHDFIKKVANQRRYRGHLLCPCGSGKRVRDCHKKEIVMALNPFFKERIVADLKTIEGENY